MNLRPKKHHLFGLLPAALVQTHGPRRGHARFLSFDDGPHPEYTPRLLDLLARHGVQASFFVVGERAERHPALIRRIVAEGHLLGNHSWSHSRFAQLSLREQVTEMERTDALLANFDDRARHRIRPPQGYLSLALLLHFARQRRSIAYWCYDSLDYRPRPVAELTTRLHRHPPAVGDIELMHDDSARAGAALDALLPPWLGDGYVFHAMSPEQT